jgi:hypothetical protein
MKDKYLNILAIMMLTILIPFCASVWALLTSEVLGEFVSVILSDNKILGFFMLSYWWLTGIGRLSEYVRVHRENQDK